MTLSPRAITMWDFSWLERRWPGAGYEDWGTALDELVERGYDAVRIDAYPHLVSADASRVWELLPVWTQQAWGAQSLVRVQVLPALLDFVRAARERGVAVALSSWFRRDRDDVRMRITSGADLGRVWVDTLRALDAADLLDAVFFVDLCNEFPLSVWAPFFAGDEEAPVASRTEPRVSDYMAQALAVVKAEFPDVAFTFSFAGEYDTWTEQQTPAVDLLEPHVWMAADDVTDFYEQVGYAFERYSPQGYDNVVARGKATYLEHQQRYDDALFATIDSVASWSAHTALPLATTECWAIIDYKDWPGLDWDWVLDLNARAVSRAAATGRWVALATSNFCGPQFHGVWREVSYHRRLTAMIRSARVADDLDVSAWLARSLT